MPGSQPIAEDMDRRDARQRAAERRTGLGIFVLLFLVYAWFHQGGGWNQNVRFDQIRAVVELGRWDIGDHLLYSFELDGDGATYRRLVLSDDRTRSLRLARANSLDLSLYDGRYFPNKPPGLTLLGVPAYAAILGLERALGLDPDDWWPSTLNLYLVTLATVGLWGALAGAFFHGCCRALFPELGARVRLAATLTFGLGTLMLPYATMLVDHAVVAALLLLSLRLLLALRSASDRGGGEVLLFGAGAVAGLAALLNNSAALALLGLGVWGVARWRSRAVWYAFGGLPAAAILAAYQGACFGDPLRIPQHHQLVAFQTSAPILGIFGAPSWKVLPELLFLPYRGLFFSSPVLLLATYGLARMFGERRRRGEALLFSTIFGLFLLMNLSFNGWHGGSSFGPRYLIPTIPFLALPLPLAFARFPRLSLGLAALSVLSMLLVTSVGPQVETGLRSPLSDYYLPLATGRSVRIDALEIRGPVSAHPIGPAGGGVEVFDPQGYYAQWNSFNLGELLFPRSWASLAPLLLGGGGLVAWLLRLARTPAAPPTRSGT